MRTITIISGKGGTGKTSVTGALVSLCDERSIVVDADVDAPDLEILLNPRNIEEKPFMGHELAVINKVDCTECGKCVPACPENAISEAVEIDTMLCNGCGVCRLVCPVDAVRLEKRETAKYYIAETKYGYMTHARLKPGAGNSGGLVTKLRQEAEKISEEKGIPYIFVDGSPGVGCPVIASISAADIVLIVVEPTLSAIDDMKRVIELAYFFNVQPAICINKADINAENVQAIKEFCAESDIEILGELPYSKSFVDAMLKRQTIAEYGDEEIVAKIRGVLSRI